MALYQARIIVHYFSPSGNFYPPMAHRFYADLTLRLKKLIPPEQTGRTAGRHAKKNQTTAARDSHNPLVFFHRELLLQSARTRPVYHSTIEPQQFR